MLRLTAFEFIVRVIPEACVYIFASYALSDNKLDAKRYVISSFLLAILIYFIRMLPINYGVHTILHIITQTIILIAISKIDTILAIRASIITTICLFIVELLNLLILNLILNEQLEAVMSNPISKTIYGLPSLGGFAVITLVYYYFRKRKKSKYGKN